MSLAPVGLSLAISFSFPFIDAGGLVFSRWLRSRYYYYHVSASGNNDLPFWTCLEWLPEKVANASHP